MKSTAELLAAHLRKTLGQEGHGRPKPAEDTQRDMVRRFLSKKLKTEGADAPVDLAPPADSDDGDTAGLTRKLARAKAAVLQKPTKDEGHGLADLMGD